MDTVPNIIAPNNSLIFLWWILQSTVVALSVGALWVVKQIFDLRERIAVSDEKADNVVALIQTGQKASAEQHEELRKQITVIDSRIHSLEKYLRNGG